MGVMDTLNWLGETATKPSAAVLGLMAGRPGQLANLIPFSDTMGITNPRDRSTGRSVLEGWGMSKNRPGLDMGDVAGFGLEMATDPLNWIGLGAIGRTANAAKAARATNATVGAERAAIEAANTASQAMRTAGALPEEMLPQMQKYYRYNPVTDDQVSGIPGLLDKPTFASRDWRDLPYPRQPQLPPGVQLVNDVYDFDHAYELTAPNAVRQIQDLMEPMVDRTEDLARSIFDQSLNPKTIRRSGSDYPGKMAVKGEELWNTLQKNLPSNLYQNVDNQRFVDVEDLFERTNELSRAAASIRANQALVPIQGSVRNQPNLQTLALRKMRSDSDNFPSQAGIYPEGGTNTGALILADLLDNTPGMERYGEVLRSSEEMAGMAQKAADTIAGFIRPARPTSQSFYGPLAGQVDSRLYGSDALLSEGARTYLPYIAPQMKPYYSDFVDVPNFSKTLQAMLGYNALAPMGRQ